MIEWYKNKKRRNRLFLDKAHESQFKNDFVNKGAIIKQCEALKRSIERNDTPEIESRQTTLRRYFAIPPQTAIECSGMIEDIIKWRL